MLSVDGDADAAVEARIRIGWNKFRQLVPLLTNKMGCPGSKAVKRSLLLLLLLLYKQGLCLSILFNIFELCCIAEFFVLVLANKIHNNKSGTCLSHFAAIIHLHEQLDKLWVE